MEARAATTAGEPTIGVSKRDLVEVWSTLEKVVVSLHKIGSHYATPDQRSSLSDERERELLRAMNEFMSGETWRELSRARQLLADRLPDDETEHLSEHVIQYWEPGRTARQE